MSIANYTDLLASIASWLHRTNLTAQAPDFVALAEARLARQLRLQRMLVATSGLNTVGGTGTVALPTRWVEWQRVRVATPNTPLEPLTPGQFQGAYTATETGVPRNYTIEGNLMRLGPIPDAIYSIDGIYFQMPEALSVTTSNWLLTAHPGLYLWAALAEAAPFIGADARLQLWEGKFNADLEQARRLDDRARFGGAALRQRAR